MTPSTSTAAANAALGAYGEAAAARYLTECGLTVLDRNWRCRAGEIDLVLRDGAVLVICEVKTRTSTAFGTPHEAVTTAKLARLQRLAGLWQAAHGLRVPEVRVDMVCVLRPRRGPTVLDHVVGIG